MQSPERRTFTARAEALAEVLAFAEQWAARAGLHRDLMLRLRLVTEELFLNVALHGYAGAGGEVQIQLAELDTEVELTLEDGAAAFDPLRTLPLPAKTGNPFERPVGKLGIPLVVQFSARRSYTRSGDRNIMRVALAKQARPG